MDGSVAQPQISHLHHQLLEGPEEGAVKISSELCQCVKISMYNIKSIPEVHLLLPREIQW